MKVKGIEINFRPSVKQEIAWGFLQDKTTNFVGYGGAAYGGKAQALDSEVVTPFGYRQMKDLKIGQTILNPDGFPQKIIAIFDHKNKDIYRIKFDDGTETKCCGEHLWNVRQASKKTKTDTNWRVKTTLQVKEYVEKGYYNLVIPTCKEQQFTVGYKTCQIRIPPYTLGVLIGDGCLVGSTPRFSSMDKEVIEGVISDGFKLRPIDGLDYSIVGSDLKKNLIYYKLQGTRSYEKFIPKYYKWASVEVRSALLQGLLDTDGTVSNDDGSISFCSVSKQLIDDVCFIVRSLGGRASYTSKIPFYRDKNKNKVICKRAYVINIAIPNGKRFFRIIRKADRVKADIPRDRRIISVEYIGKEDARCIRVDNPNSLYMTNDFIVTHNTNLECYWLIISSLAYPGTAWGLGRKELSVLKKTALVSLFEIFQDCNIKPDRDYKFNGQDNKITFTNGSVIFLIDTAFQPSDPLYTRFGGLELTGCAVDESAETNELAIDILFTRCGRKKNDIYGLPAKFLETFNPSKTHVYRRYYKPWKENKLPDHYKFVQAFPQDNPHPSAKTYVETILKNGSKQTIARLIHGNFEYDDDPAALIIYDKMVDVFSNFHVPGGQKCMTNDLARLGGDRIVSIEWDGFRGYVTATAKQTLDVTGKQIEEKRLKLGVGKSDVLCDEDGLGGGVVDYEHFKGFVNNATPLPNPENPTEPENYDNLKSQCSYRMADRINKNGLLLICAEEWMKAVIIEEMEQVKQKAMDSDQKKGIVSRKIMMEVIGHSPDFWSTIMMREWFELKPNFVVTADSI